MTTKLSPDSVHRTTFLYSGFSNMLKMRLVFSSASRRLQRTYENSLRTYHCCLLEHWPYNSIFSFSTHKIIRPRRRCGITTCDDWFIFVQLQMRLLLLWATHSVIAAATGTVTLVQGKSSVVCQVFQVIHTLMLVLEMKVNNLAGGVVFTFGWRIM